MASVAACRSPREPPQEPSAPSGPDAAPGVYDPAAPKDTLVIASLTDVNSLLPVVQQAATDAAITENLMLSSRRSEVDCRLTFHPEMITGWSWNADQTVLTQKLTPGLTWSDGKPVTVEDFRFAYDLLADPKVASPRGSLVAHMVEGKRPEKIDEHTMAFHFTHAYDETTMLAHTSWWPLPRHVLEKADRATLRGHPFGRSPVVLGPWKVSALEPGSKVVLEPNPAYSGPPELRARLAKVVFKILPEYGTRLVELENGSVDVVENVLVPDAARLARERPDINLHRRGWRSMDYVGWNQLDPRDYVARKAQAKSGQELEWAKVKPHRLFADKAVRRALTQAIDVPRLIEVLLTAPGAGGRPAEVYGRPAISTISPSLCDAHANRVAPLGHDAEAAKRALDAAGWKDTDGDGVRDRDGVRFEFSLLTNAGNARRAKAVVLVQAMLAVVGVKANIEQLETATFFDRLRKKDYDAHLSGWSGGLFVDMSTLWHSGEKFPFNFTGYRNPQVDRLIEEALAAPSPAVNLPLWKEVQARIYEDQPYTFLYWMDSIVAVAGRFQGVEVDMLSPYRHLRSWWVPPDQIKYRGPNTRP